jgi:hypothetical protein
MKKAFYLFLFFFNLGFSIYVGNPSDPIILKNSIIKNNLKNYSIQLSYIQDNIYKSDFQDKFDTLQTTPSDVKILSYLSQVTFNILNRIDLNFLIGSSSLKVDNLIKTDNHLSYGVGLKTILYTDKDFDIGIDFKFFRCDFKPTYFLVDDEEDGSQIYNIVGKFKQRYDEYIGSLLISYKTPLLNPYIGLSYIFADLVPDPSVGIIFIPGIGNYPFATSESKIRDYFGLVLGITILNINKQMLITLENRSFNQNAFSINLRARF